MEKHTSVTINVSFKTLKKAAGKQGNGVFIAIMQNGQFIECDGPIIKMYVGTPLVLTGKWENQAETVFSVDEIRFDFSNRAQFIKLVSGNAFKNVGKLAAAKIYDGLTNFLNGREIMSINRGEMRGVIEKHIKTEDTIIKIMNAVTCIDVINDFHQRMKPYDGTFYDAMTLYDKYGDAAFEKLMKAPYSMITDNISFRVLDAVGKKQKFHSYDMDRINALLYCAMSNIYQTGSACTTKKKFLSAIHFIESTQGAFKQLPDEMFLAALCASRYFECRMDGENLHIYPKKAYNTEVAIAKEVIRLQSSKTKTGIVLNSDLSSYDEDQQKALTFLGSTGIKIVTGGPGSGKTTIIRKFIDEYTKKFPNRQYYLTAPTGRAAVRISESSGFPAKTIHKLLGISVYEQNGASVEGQMFDHDHQFEKGIFVIDEMSMVGEEIFLKLLTAIPNDSLVILSGDPRQLPSVDTGNVLQDLINTGYIEVAELTHIHRSEKNMIITENYQKIKNVDSNLLTADDKFEIIRVKSEDELYSALDQITEKYDHINETKDPYQYQILTFTKKGIGGKDAINQRIASLKNQRNPETYYGRSSYSVGDKIMMTKNNYAEDYFNGDVGLISSITDEGFNAVFYSGERHIKSSCFKDVDHAWACTVHKSQGSEYNNVVIVVDDEFDNMLYNSLILTAITRAKDRVFIITMQDALRRSIETVKTDSRITGLKFIVNERREGEPC